MAAQGARYTYIAAATAAVTNRFVTSTNMKVGAYTVANTTMPTGGARQVTVAVTAGATADTMGTITVVGTGIGGGALSETITPVAGSTVTGSKWFVTVTAVTGAGWVIDAVEGTNDTIIVGCAAPAGAHDGDGVLKRVIVGETAAGAITLADSAGTIAVLKASIVEGAYDFEVEFADYLAVTVAGASKVSVITA